MPPLGTRELAANVFRIHLLPMPETAVGRDARQQQQQGTASLNKESRLACRAVDVIEIVREVLRFRSRERR